MTNFIFFWHLMKFCNWGNGYSDQQILFPVIRMLSEKEDGKIFEFHDTMSELLYNLDTRKLYEQCKFIDPSTTEESFLYTRCVALINGATFYKEVKIGRGSSIWDREYRPLLAIPQTAWEKKHAGVPYPHTPKFNVTTGSNRQGWL